MRAAGGGRARRRERGRVSRVDATWYSPGGASPRIGTEESRSSAGDHLRHRLRRRRGTGRIPHTASRMLHPSARPGRPAGDHAPGSCRVVEFDGKRRGRSGPRRYCVMRAPERSRPLLNSPISYQSWIEPGKPSTRRIERGACGQGPPRLACRCRRTIPARRCCGRGPERSRQGHAADA